MSVRDNGGVIGKSATPSILSASGIWNLKSAYLLKQRAAWPYESGVDPYWNDVSILLQGDGTNGAQNGTFVDSSANAFAISTGGTIDQGAFSPYTIAAPYTGSIGSFQTKTTASYVQSASGAALNIGTGDVTIEGWFYFTSLGSYNTIFAPDTQNFQIDLRSSNKLFAYVAATGTSGTGSTSVVAGQWYHFAVVRASGTIKGYLDGAEQFSFANTSNLTANTSIRIGHYHSGTNYGTAYFSDIRVVKSAVYTGNFTRPTSPLGTITDTSLHLKFANAGVIDGRMKSNVETVGNAQISTSVKKYGTGALKFDGTGDWLVVSDSAGLQFGTGAFTVECWLYLGATGAARGVVGKGTSSTGWLLSTDSSNKVVFTYGSSTITSTGALSGSTWYHIAVVREGTGSNQTKIYIDGSNDGAGTVSTDFTQTNVLYVGANRTGGDALNGYVDDLRITKGAARYTGNFTAPTTALDNKGA